MPQSHHTPGPRTGCSRAVLRKKILRPQTGPARVPCGTVRIFASRAGPAWPNTTLVRDFLQFRLCKFPYVSRTSPVDYEKNIEYSLAGPARCPYGHRTWYTRSPANYSTKPCVNPYGARSLMWPQEQHQRKIPVRPSLGLTGKKIVRVIKIKQGPWLDMTEELAIEHIFT